MKNALNASHHSLLFLTSVPDMKAKHLQVRILIKRDFSQNQILFTLVNLPFHCYLYYLELELDDMSVYDADICFE